MPETVIVAVSRPPVGRARKGPPAGPRADDPAARLVHAALDQIPALRPVAVGDRFPGCGLPGGEQGYTTARGLGITPWTSQETMCVGGGQSMAIARERLA